MILVPLAPGDADTLAKLHAECFDVPWNAAAFQSLLSGPGVFGWGVPDAAFILARVAAGEGEILTLATLPRARRRGHAKDLVHAAARDAVDVGAIEMFLEVASDNLPALALYSGLGFARAGQRPRYYEEPDGAKDALILRAPLPLSVAKRGPIG